MRDTIGTELGSWHHLYELNYTGTTDAIRLQRLGAARASGEMKKMHELSQRFMSAYDVNGWKIPSLK